MDNKWLTIENIDGEVVLTECSKEAEGEIVIPEGVTKIGDEAFKNCRSITSITFPNGLVSIGKSLFGRKLISHTNLIKIVIPDTVTTIGYRAFEYCSKLSSVFIPCNVVSIGKGAFSCKGLTSIVVDKDNAVYDSRNNCNAIIETATNTLLLGCCNTTIPDSVTSIGERAFCPCENLTSIVIPNSVKTIGNQAFWMCDSLKSIVIPESVISIGKYAFDYEMEICIPEKLVCVGYNTSGPYIKMDIGAQEKKWLKFEKENDEVVLTKCSNEAVGEISIPKEVDRINEGAFSHCQDITSIIIPETVKAIGKSAFYCCDSLTSMIIPDSVTTIGEHAFFCCRKLKSIKLSNQLTEISPKLFRGCRTLTKVILPDALVDIKDWAFLNCEGLTSITIPQGVKHIGNSAFHSTGLTSITIPSSVTSIEIGAFGNCQYMKRIIVDKDNRVYDSREDCNAIIETSTNTLVRGCINTIIPQSVTSIGKYGFDKCSGLTTIVLPDSIESIEDWSFAGCADLTSIIIPNGVKSIGKWSFFKCI